MLQVFLVTLFASCAFGSNSLTHNDNNDSYEFPITAMLFACIFFAALIPTGICWITARKNKNRFNYEIANQSIIALALLESDVERNITITAKSRPALLSELRSGENLVWAHEITPASNVAIILLHIALFVASAGFLMAFAVMLSVNGTTELIFVCIWIPFLFAWIISFAVGGAMMSCNANTLIYALTSKRVLIYSSNRGSKCCGGPMETVRDCDIDGIHQTTIIHRDDGTGTLTFSVVIEGAPDYINQQHHSGAFAFANIPNVRAVKGLIELYKAMRKKHSDNQVGLRYD